MSHEDTKDLHAHDDPLYEVSAVCRHSYWSSPAFGDGRITVFELFLKHRGNREGLKLKAQANGPGNLPRHRDLNGHDADRDD